MRLKEGSGATFVGVGDPVAKVGDRCLVLSDEGPYANVRWVTGSRVGGYTKVAVSDLVADQRVSVSAFDDDEFGFEAAAPKAVRVATAAVHASGGHAALMHALGHEGLVAEATDRAITAVASLRSSLLGDRAWAEVVSDLGEDGPSFLRYAMNDLLTKAMSEVGNNGI